MKDYGMKRIDSTCGDGVYLLSDGDRYGLARTFNHGVLSAPVPLQSALARGYWENYEGPQELLAELLGKVEEAQEHKHPPSFMDPKNRQP